MPFNAALQHRKLVRARALGLPMCEEHPLHALPQVGVPPSLDSGCCPPTDPSAQCSSKSRIAPWSAPAWQRQSPELCQERQGEDESNAGRQEHAQAVPPSPCPFAPSPILLSLFFLHFNLPTEVLGLQKSLVQAKFRGFSDSRLFSVAQSEEEGWGKQSYRFSSGKGVFSLLP